MTAAGSQPVALIDAVCCVHFCAAGKDRLLLRLLSELHWEILVPEEVSKEVLGNVARYPTVRVAWKRFIASDRVRLLPIIELYDEGQAPVRDKVAELRGTSAALALSERKDLGEHLVVGHAAVMKAAGRRVFVLMDDLAGQSLATGQRLDVVDMERLLELGHRLGLSDLDTKAKVRTAYSSLVPYGSSLVGWDQSRLKALLRGKATRANRS